MKKYFTSSFSFSILLIAASIILFIGLLPKPSFAKDVYIKTKPGEVHVISEPVFIREGDTLTIAAGTKIDILADAHIYAQGDIFIGTDGPVTENPKPVIITSYSHQAAMSIDGGKMIAIGVQFSGKKFLEAYRNADVSITSSEINDTYARLILHHEPDPFISLFQNSKLDLSHTTLNSLSNIVATTTDYPFGVKRQNFIEIFSESSASISDVSIHSNISTTIVTVYSQSRIEFNRTQILSCEQLFLVHESSHVSGNIGKSNCGPMSEAFNNSTITVTYDYKPCCSSILFIPGMQGSRLYRKQVLENQLWEPNRDADIEKLFLNEFGQSVLSGIYTKDIIEKTNILPSALSSSVYGGFVKFLKKMRDDKLIENYGTFPYDWRNASDELANEALQSKIEELARKSYNGKVTIVAHSYGGLIAKSMLSKMAGNRKSHLIENVVLVGVPETGAPESLFALLQGHGQAMIGGILVKAKTAMQLAINMPSAYILLPSQIYSQKVSLLFRQAGEYKSKKYDIPLPIEVNKVIAWIKSRIVEKGNTGDIIIGTENPTPTQNLLQLQKKGNDLLQAEATSTHAFYQLYDSGLWNAYKSWSIAGVGMQTIMGMAYEYRGCGRYECRNQALLGAWPLYSSDGDGTVILDSKYNRLGNLIRIDLPELNKVRGTNIKHSTFLESEDVQSIIRQIIVSDHVGTTQQFIVDDGSPTDNERYMHRITVQGNVIGGIQGQHEGKTYATEIIKSGDTQAIIEGIPNSSLSVFGDTITIASQLQPTRIAFTSMENQRIHIEIEKLTHQDDGTFTGPSSTSENLDDSEYLAGVYHFQDIPAARNATLEFNPSTGMLIEDTDNNGVGDLIFSPTQIIPATTTASSTPTLLQTDLDILINHLEIKRDSLNDLAVYSLRTTYTKKISRMIDELRKVSLRLQKPNNTQTAFTAKEMKAMRKHMTTISDAVRRIQQLEISYNSILLQAEEVLRTTPAFRSVKKAAERKTNAELYLKDLGRLYIVFATLEDELLEFLAKHGTIGI